MVRGERGWTGERSLTMGWMSGFCAMSGDLFKAGTPMHGLCLVVCAVMVMVFIPVAKRCPGGRRQVILRRFAGFG